MLTVQRPTISEEALVEGRRSRFEVEPLEPGYGYTIGNSLRRTLLSSIPGAAVTSVQIEGVLHEFSSLEGCKEDVTDIILNVKELVLRYDGDGPMDIFLGAQGPGPLTADYIHAPAEVEVLNPDLHVATLNEEGRIEMYLRVERGRGYRTAEQNRERPDADPRIGTIPVDSVFSPVRKVTYRVEPTRVGQMTNYDKLVLDVETDGSVSPAEAFSSASETLRDLLAVFAEHTESGPGGLPVDLGFGLEEQPPELEMAIDDLDLSPRAYNSLRRAGLDRVGDLVGYTGRELLEIEGFGEKSVTELRERLAGLGLQLADEADVDPGVGVPADAEPVEPVEDHPDHDEA